MTNEATAYNAINIGLSESNSLQSTNNIPITAELDEHFEKFTERAKQARQYQRERCGETPNIVEPGEGFHPVDVWDEVPHIRDNYFDRKEKLASGGWANEEKFLRLYNENFEDYSKIQAESYLAAQFAFAFGKNKEIVAYQMEKEIDFQTEFEVNPEHRAYIFEVVEEVPFVYCEGVDLDTKFVVALRMKDWQVATVPHLCNELDMSDDQIRRTLRVLEAEGLVEREPSHRQNEPDSWSDKGITESYLSKLLADKGRLEEGE